jgi:hypothetical protein
MRVENQNCVISNNTTGYFKTNVPDSWGQGSQMQFLALNLVTRDTFSKPPV